MQQAPAISCNKVEQKEMFHANKTPEYLARMSTDERRETIRWATSEGRKIRAKEKKQEESYVRSMQQILEASRKHMTEKNLVVLKKGSWV